MKIQTSRKFRIKPKGPLYYNVNPDCAHRRFLLLGSCEMCLRLITAHEIVGHDAEFDTDGLTYSHISAVYLKVDGKKLRCEAAHFDIINEVT